MSSLIKYLTILILLALSYCSIPFKDIFIVTLEVTSNEGTKITEGLNAIFLDDNNQEIAEISITHPESFNNTLVWWVHSSYPEKSGNIETDKALKATKAIVSATGCKTKEVPLDIMSYFEPLSFSIHGGGPAYMYHFYEGKIKIDCSHESN